MPVSRPEMTMPTLRPLFSGREKTEAMGTKIWGIMEPTPVSSDAAQMMRMSVATAIVSSEQTSRAKLVRMIFLRG